MVKFEDVRTGVIENVTNEELIEQYRKHKDVYKEIVEKKDKNK